MNDLRFKDALDLRHSGRLDDAAREFRLMAADTADVNAKAALLLNEVRCYASLWRLDDASKVMEEISQLGPIDPEVRINVSYVAARLSDLRKQHEQAALQYGNLLEQYAQLLATEEYRDFYEDTCLQKAIQLTNCGRFAEALPCLKEATSFRTLTAEARQEAYLYVGICLSETGEDDLAKQEFQRAISFNLLNDTEIHARYRLAIQYFTEGGFAQAKHQLETVLNDYKAVVASVPLKYIYEQLSRACHYLGEEENAHHYATMGRKCS